MTAEEQIAAMLAMPSVRDIVLTCERGVPDAGKTHYHARADMTGVSISNPHGSGDTMAAALAALRTSLAEHYAHRVAVESANLAAMKEAVRALTESAPAR